MPAHRRLVRNYLAGPRALLRRDDRFADARVRLDGSVYHSTDPLESLSQDLLVVEFVDAADGPRLVPVVEETAEGAQTYSYVQVEDQGRSRPFSHKAADVPRVSVETAKFEHPIIPIGCFYDWTSEDGRAAELALANGWPVDLPAEKARAANQSNAREVTRTALLGLPALGISGLANEAAVQVVALPNGDWTDAATTPAEIFEDCQAVIRAVAESTRNQRRANVLLCGTTAYYILQTTYRATGSDQTLLQALEAAHEADGLTIEPSAWLDESEADDGGRLVAYQRDPDVIRQDVPIVYDEQPPQFHRYTTEIYTESRCTGTVVRRPAAVAYGTGAIL